MTDINTIQQITNMEILTISISIIAIIISIWSWKESKKANSISKHPMQLEVYDAFNDLKSQIYIHGMDLKEQEVSKFYKFSQKSIFYFDICFANKLQNYFNICRELVDLKRRYYRDNEQRKDTKEIENRQDILQEKEELLSNEIEAEFKKILII